MRSIKQVSNLAVPPSDSQRMPWGDGEAPRVLVIGPDLPHLGAAGSILLHRLFQGWPPESLLAVGPAVPASVLKHPCRFLARQPLLHRFENTRAARLLRLLRALRLVPAARIALPDFQPDVVVHILSSLACAEMACSYSVRSGVPLILILHDDPEDFNRSYPWTNLLIRQQVQRIYRHAAVRLCVSPEMEGTLRERHGVAGVVMYPNRSEAITPRHPQVSGFLREPGVLTLGFAGGMSYGYGDRLLELVPVFRAASVKLRVYGGNLPVTGCSDVLLNQGRISSPEVLWERVQSECDAVLLPYCLPHHGHQQLFRTHFPSKLPEYLALGMPVVVTGPSYATGVKWGLSHPEACVVVADQGGDMLAKVLTELRLDGELRMRLSTNSVVAGNHDFDPVAIRSLFHEHLRDSARGFQARFKGCQL